MKETTPTEEQRRIAWQLNLDPEEFARQVALNQRSTDSGLYVSFSTRELMKRVTYHQTNSDLDGLVRALSDTAAHALDMNSDGDSLSLRAAVSNAAALCQKILEALM